MQRSLSWMMPWVALSSTFAVGCGSSSSKSTSTTPTVEPTADTQAFITAAQDYATWKNFPEQQTPKFSPGHGNMYVLAFYNAQVDTSEKSGTLPLIDGSIIVKENFKNATDTDPTTLTVMAKKNAKWYWYEQTPDGKIAAPSGGVGLQGYDLAACSGCHEKVQSNDYVFTHQFKTGAAGAGGAGAGGAGAGGAGNGAGGSGGAGP